MIVWSAFVAGELADRGIGFPVGPAGRAEVQACREAARAGARAVVFAIASRQPAAEWLRRPREIGAAAAAQTPRESSPKGNQRTDSSFGSLAYLRQTKRPGNGCATGLPLQSLMSHHFRTLVANYT